MDSPCLPQYTERRFYCLFVFRLSLVFARFFSLRTGISVRVRYTTYHLSPQDLPLLPCNSLLSSHKYDVE